MTTIHNYRQMLRVNKLRLDDELEVQAELQERIGAEVTRLAARMAEAKDDLAATEARLADDFRDGGEKLSVDAVTAKVRRSSERKAAWDKFQRATSDHAEWGNLLESWKVRGFSMRDLSLLYSGDYFAITSTGGGQRAERPRDRAVEAIRDIQQRNRENMNGFPMGAQESMQKRDAPRPRRRVLD